MDAPGFQFSIFDLNQFNEKMDEIFINYIAVVIILQIFEADEHENNAFFDEAILLCTKADKKTFPSNFNEKRYR